jgi:hypothetical protein
VRFPSSLTFISSIAFPLCTGLKTAYFQGPLPGSDIPLLTHPSSARFHVFSGNAPGFRIYFFDSTKPGGFEQNVYGINIGTNLLNYSAVVPWLLEHDQAHNVNLQSDPDGDGVSLLMAYALNLDPRKNLASSLPKPMVAGNTLSLSYHAGSEGVSYRVEASADLQNWSTAGVTLSTPGANGDVTASLPISGPRKFMRVVAAY